MAEERTIVACLTPAGTAALATIGLRGPDAVRLVESCFSPCNHNTPMDRPRLGKLGDAFRDDVVVSIQGDQVEIHCHGGHAVVRGFIDLFVRRGAVEIGWEAWLRRSECSPVAADAAVALTHAKTLRTAGILLDQLNGALDGAIRQIASQLEQGDSKNARKGIDELLRRTNIGLHLTAPFRVVLAGPPNVGKSSLHNAILGFQRSIISPIPGTTRDVVTGLTALDGWLVEFSDTAGVRAPATELEAAGIAKAESARTKADLVLWIIDASESNPVVPPMGSVPVANKIDLLENGIEERLPMDAPRVSAKTGTGMEVLLQAIGRMLVPESPSSGIAVPFTTRQFDSLREARMQVEGGAISSAVELLRDLLASQAISNGGL